jgi:phosphoesterase RecJ-like protein
VNGTASGVADAIRARDRFIITSHARPDGDAVGSSVALALALDALGKTSRVVLHDAVPAPYRCFPAIGRVETLSALGPSDETAVLLECSDPGRPEIAGFAGRFVINVDHHAGNTLYGDANWFDPSAAACGEMVGDIIDALGVRWTSEMAAHLYLAIATDTGSFRYGPISPRTFEACRRIAEAGVQTAMLSREIFDSFSIGRVKLTGALLDAMELHDGNHLAILAFDDELLARCGATIDDTEGLVNIPLGAREVRAVALLKMQKPGTFRVSFRSKGAVDVRRVAGRWQGGGHANAAGCAIAGSFAEVRDAVVAALAAAIAQAD